MTDSAEQSVVVEVYLDDTKEELIAEVPIIDLGIESRGRRRPNSDEGLIYIAKQQIQATRDEAVDSLHYEVRR